MAITVDATSGSIVTNATSNTQSHTCSGSNRILIVGVALYKASSGGNDRLSSLTYNGVAMTQIAKSQGDGQDSWNYLYALVNPPSGTYNIVATTNTTGEEIAVVACSYNGAKQTGQPDAYVVNNITTSVSSITATLTTIADNCWLSGIFKNSYGQIISAGTSTTLRATAAQGVKLMDSNGSKSPAGSYSLNATLSGSPSTAPACAIVCSIAPAVDVFNSKFLQMF